MAAPSPDSLRHLPFIPYPAIDHHGVIGDMRTAALVATDGTIDWLCLPDFDGGVVFGSLLDAHNGGHFRLGPVTPFSGEQQYLEHTAVLTTRFRCDEGEVELTDAMLWPQIDRPPALRNRRVLVRRLRGVAGSVVCISSLDPRPQFVANRGCVAVPGGFAFHGAAVRGREPRSLGLFTSLGVKRPWNARFSLRAGEEVWFVLGIDEAPIAWTVERAREALDAVADHWRTYVGRLRCRGPRAERLRRIAMVGQLMGYAPDGALVASPTFGLPERDGGDRNYDYRFSWVRDASLAVHAYAKLGDLETSERYLEWLCRLGSGTDAPLQVVYDVRGATKLAQHRLRRVFGYRGAQPVFVGNHAYRQRQLGSLGYVADGALTYVEEGGRWRPEFSRLVARCARYTAKSWTKRDSGIWELMHHDQYVSSKMMCWVVLDRALRLHDKLGDVASTPIERSAWEDARANIFDHVMTERWDPEIACFRERDHEHTVDAALLLVGVMKMLPASDPRVRSTIERIVTTLGVDGFLCRFVPKEIPGERPLPVGEFEGAFLPCSFWLATVYALDGKIDQAEAVMATAERAANHLGLFSEEYDARDGRALGNYPLLFSLVEYARAALAIEDARDAAARSS